MFSFFKKLLGSDDTANGQTTSSSKRVVTSGDNTKVEDFVAFVVNSLVDNPDNVKVEVISNGSCDRIQISCDKGDIGKIIGKRGKTIAAIRALSNGAAGRLGKKVNVEVLD